MVFFGVLTLHVAAVAHSTPTNPQNVRREVVAITDSALGAVVDSGGATWLNDSESKNMKKISGKMKSGTYFSIVRQNPIHPIVLTRTMLIHVIANNIDTSNTSACVIEVSPIIEDRYFMAVTRSIELLAHDIIQYVQPVKKLVDFPNASSTYVWGPPLFVKRDDISEKMRARAMAPATDTSHPQSPRTPYFANDDGNTKTPDPN
jgi:hypothetical protein